MAYKHKN